MFLIYMYIPLFHDNFFQNGDKCEFAHVKLYDDFERGFSDSSTKRKIGREVLSNQILSVLQEADSVVYNFDIFER